MDARTATIMVTITIKVTTMIIDETQALYTMQTWFSPSFPVGAFSYSHGLENAFETGLINDLDQAIEWIADIILSGNGFADAVFLNDAHRAVSNKDFDRLTHVVEYATAFCGTQELRLESNAQGAAFIDTVLKVSPNCALSNLRRVWSGPCPYAVAVGAASADLGINEKSVTTAFLHAFVSNLSSALVRIVPLGQTDGQRIISRLLGAVETTVSKSLHSSLEDLSVSTLMVDLTSMQHETQYTRLFRS